LGGRELRLILIIFIELESTKFSDWKLAALDRGIEERL